MALDSRRTWKEQQEQMDLPSFATATSRGQRPHHGACFQRPDKPTGLSPNLLHPTGGTKSLFVAMLQKHQAIYQADSNVTRKQMSYLNPRY